MSFGDALMPMFRFTPKLLIKASQGTEGAGLKKMDRAGRVAQAVECLPASLRS
jgi:hypothetical protein